MIMKAAIFIYESYISAWKKTNIQPAYICLTDQIG